MPAKKDAAGELAARMVQVLQAQCRLGEGSYPLALRRLAELIEPGLQAEVVLKAVKKKHFSDQAIAVQPKDLDTPVALAEDQKQLAASGLLLEYLLESVCTPEKPICDPAKLKRKVP